MTPLDNCFVENVRLPALLIDVGVPVPVHVPVSVAGEEEGQQQQQQQQQPATECYQVPFSTAESLTAHFDKVKDDGYTCRFISICQSTSWRPLQVTKPALEAVASTHGLDPSFWELPSCFYTRNLEVEQVYCVPYTECRNGPFIELSYTVKHPEYKPADGKWVIRHTGIYHRFDTRTSQSTYVLFSPTPNSRLHQRAEEWLLSHRDDAASEPFWLHRLLFLTYYPAWRQHIAALESQLLPIANKTFATFIDQPLGIGYDKLSELVSIEKQLLQIPALLGPATDVLSELGLLLAGYSPAAAHHPGTRALRNLHRQCGGYARTASHLQQRAQITAQLLSDTLSFRDQGIAKQQNENMLRLNKSAVFITTLTLLYLPASFVASFFGANFWAFDTEKGTIVGTDMIWIFVVSSAVLTAMTFLFYYWLLHRDGTVFRRLEPKISRRIPPEWNLKELTRRWTANGKHHDAVFEMSQA